MHFPAICGHATRLALLVALPGLVVVSALAPANATVIRMETSLGDVDVRMYGDLAPNSVTNFLNYVTSGRYVDTFIHRVPQLPTGGSSNFVIQGGGFLLNDSIFDATGIVTDDPIADEPNISNLRGTLSMAKNSLGATSQWFYNIGDSSFLDSQGFTVVGRVLGDGMDVIDAINALPIINASAAENVDGEDFDEIPVRDLDQVLLQNDITANEAVMITTVTVLSDLDGDFNFDGIVDAVDYSVWRDTDGSTTLAQADGNGDGVVDSDDYDLWQASFGGAAAAAAAGIPEPTTVALAGLALSALGVRRRA